MVMINQPPGIRRVRIGEQSTDPATGKKQPVNEYTIFWRREAGEQAIGKTERRPGGKWRAWPADGALPGNDQANHTLAVLELIDLWEKAHQGEVLVTPDPGSCGLPGPCSAHGRFACELTAGEPPPDDIFASSVLPESQLAEMDGLFPNAAHDDPETNFPEAEQGEASIPQEQSVADPLGANAGDDPDAEWAAAAAAGQAAPPPGIVFTPDVPAGLQVAPGAQSVVVPGDLQPEAGAFESFPDGNGTSLPGAPDSVPAGVGTATSFPEGGLIVTPAAQPAQVIDGNPLTSLPADPANPPAGSPAAGGFDPFAPTPGKDPFAAPFSLGPGNGDPFEVIR